MNYQYNTMKPNYAYEILVCSALDTELHLNHGNFKLLSFLRAILLL